MCQDKQQRTDRSIHAIIKSRRVTLLISDNEKQKSLLYTTSVSNCLPLLYYAFNEVSRVVESRKFARDD